MAKFDLKKELKEFYAPSAKTVSLVDVPAMNFLMLDGLGAPEGPAFQQAIEALYTFSYTLKFARKKSDGTDYAVMPLEGLWWAEDMAAFDPETADRESWQWTLMIMQPDFITRDEIENAREATEKKKDNPDIAVARFESFREGAAAQIMHVGPFSEEGPNVRKLHEKITEIGSRLSGNHHEIYLSDFRKVDPLKMKTVLRQPYTL